MIDAYVASLPSLATKPHLYRASGLDGIFLLNGFTFEHHDGEAHVSVQDLIGLHQAIGRHVVCRGSTLAPKEIKFLRNTLDLTQAELAERLGNTSQSVARWEKGECDIPGASQKLLCVVFLAAVLAPDEIELLRSVLTSERRSHKSEDMPSTISFEFVGKWREKTSP